MITNHEPAPPGWAPGPLDQPGLRAHRGRRWPLLLAAAVGAALLCWLLTPGQPASIAESRLTGPRPPGTIDVVVLLDNSGSFQQYAPIRQQSLQEVMTWTGKNLRPDDTVTVIEFAGDAGLVLPTTRVGDVAGRSAVTSARLDGTLIVPPVVLARQSLTSAAPKSLIVVTDTEVQDPDPTSIDPLVADLHVTSMTVVVPTGVDVTDAWSEVFPYENVVTADNGDAGDTSLAMARAIANATGQQLVKIS